MWDCVCQSWGSVCGVIFYLSSWCTVPNVEATVGERMVCVIRGLGVGFRWIAYGWPRAVTLPLLSAHAHTACVVLLCPLCYFVCAGAGLALEGSEG